MTTVTTSGIAESPLSTVSWGAVIAGAAASAAVTLLLLALGVGLGFSVISPWADQGVSATTFHIGAGIYMIVVAMIASTIGGYSAGRLRARWAGVHADEVYFRDTAHGFLTWAVATLFSAAVLGAATTHLLAGASAGSIPAAGAGAAQAMTSPNDVYVDTLLRADTAPAVAGTTSPAATPGTTAAPMTGGDLTATRGELGRLLAPSFRSGELSTADRAYVGRVVSARTGISQAEADRRVSDTVAQAKKAADDARRAALKAALWLAAAMFAGALAAALAAIEGGILRDSKWYAPGWSFRRARSEYAEYP